MPLELWLAYVATILVLMSTPGPSHLLMLSNSMRYGFRPSLATAAGDLSANTLQMLAAATGLASLLYTSETAFAVVKWSGVGYLVYLGLRALLRRTPPRAQAPAPRRRALYLQGFVTSAANPKAVVFFAALFPQFLDPARPLLVQLVVLGSTYLVIDGLFLSGYGFFSDWLGRRVNARWFAVTGRLSGVFLIGAAALLGFKELEPRGAAAGR